MVSCLGYLGLSERMIFVGKGSPDPYMVGSLVAVPCS